MNYVKKQIQSTQEGQRIWPISRQWAWRLVKTTLGERYDPHALRLSRSVRFLDDPSTTVPEMQSLFGWKSVQTISAYTGFSQRHIDSQAQRLRGIPSFCARYQHRNCLIHLGRCYKSDKTVKEDCGGPAYCRESKFELAELNGELSRMLTRVIGKFVGIDFEFKAEIPKHLQRK